jgi:hypothetical protein
MDEFLKPTLTEFFEQIADEFRALPNFRGSVSVAWWANPAGITMGYLSWQPIDDAAADNADLCFTLLPLSTTQVDAQFDLAWSSGELITELSSRSLSFASPANLKVQIETLLARERDKAIQALGQLLVPQS